MKILLYGNPNVGKTSFFNATSKNSHLVSNYAGTTVQKKSALSIDGNFEVVDIPGIRTLVSKSEDEKVALKSLLDDEYTKIINVLDGTNLQRNLYLAIQLLETNK